MKRLLFLISISVLLTITAVFLVKPSLGKQDSSRIFALPKNAQQVSENVYYLGKAFDSKAQEIEGYAFLHRKDVSSRATKPARREHLCYGYLASGAKWKTIEDWVINPVNSRGLSENTVFTNFSNDIEKWEIAAEKDVVGNGNIRSEELVADTISPDNNNEVYFTDVSEPDVIAVTIVWGYFNGRPQNRSLIEWDQVYDDVDFDWSLQGETEKMDFENIATHEIGHSFGMDDVYETVCSEVTEYGYADYGETKKRTLEQADITGVKALYR